MKEEALRLERNDKTGLQVSYGNQAAILKDWARFEQEMALLGKTEALCLERRNRSGLLAYCYWTCLCQSLFKGSETLGGVRRAPSLLPI
jgi:hypothetical protein